MKEIHRFLKVFIFVQLGWCVGRVFIKYLDYIKNPGIYEMLSDPWYYDVIPTIIFTAVTVTIMTIAFFVIGHLIKKPK